MSKNHVFYSFTRARKHEEKVFLYVQVTEAARAYKMARCQSTVTMASSTTTGRFRDVFVMTLEEAMYLCHIIYALRVMRTR